MTGSKQKKEMLLIRDLVELPEVRTVIQLQDLTDPGLRQLILETFVLTGEVLENLQAILTSLSERQGRGVFLKGHFGSGKSHFLSMLSLLLGEPRSWQVLVDQEPSLEVFAGNLDSLRFLVVEVSLVQHRGSEFLEDIMLRAIFKELGRLLERTFEGAETRHETFTQIETTLQDLSLSGMVLLVDELSEFLRSKPDARAYNEDVRFLQYLGEQAAAFPLWIIASLQEWIEETGEIHQDTFNKIKDRYRVRISLGRAHIEELVSHRLIRHKEGAEAIIGEIFKEVKAHFDTFPVAPKRFAQLYPIHPATITLLDRLKPLFSEHRGVVDFIHFRLKGDPERHIPSFLERNPHDLLTPEVIFDHFLDRIRERSESQIYVERVFAAYEDEIPELFQDLDQQRIALAAVKLLILFAISPVKFKYTVRHMAEMILCRVTPMEAEINYQFFHDILDRLAKEGSYVRVEMDTDPLKSHYYIDLKADVAAIMRRRVRHLATEIFPEDHRLFTKLAGMVDSLLLPLAGWVEQGRQQLGVKWQHTRRGGLLLLRQLDELSTGEVEALARQWTRGEDDFFVLVGTTHGCDRQSQHVRKNLLPMIREHYPGMFLFWIPAALEDEASWLKEMLAAVLLLEKVKQEDGETSRRARAYLENLLEKEKGQLTEFFTRRYFHGLLLWDERQVDLAPFGYLSQEKFLQEFVRPALDRCFPRHNRIHPYMEIPAPPILASLLKDFFAVGVLQVNERSKFASRDVLEGLLKPMGLVKKKGNQYQLQVDPRRNELVQGFLEEMGTRKNTVLEELYWSFRKGDYGLLRPQFEILVMALLCSGHLVAYQGARKKGLEDIVRSGLKGITALGRGEILEEELRRTITSHPLIPERFRKAPLTLASQEELWSEIRSAKEEALEDLRALLSRIEWAAAFQAFRNLPWKRSRKEIETIISQWEEVKVSLPSREGLERFLRSGQREPFLAEKLGAVHEVKGFLAQAERALFVYQYLTDPRLHFPENAGYGALWKDRDTILDFYQKTSSSITSEALEELFRNFQRFQDQYIKAYVDGHQRGRGGEQFQPYEKLTRSRKYGLLKRLDRLEMISVQHNRRSIDQNLSAVLNHRCLHSPQDHLQGQPACSCGFRLGESSSFKPLRELTREIDDGIVETLEALQSPSVQEKLLPYLEGLDLVGKKEQANGIRRLLEIPAKESAEIFDQVEQAVTPQVLEGINEAFRGKVVVVQRNLDELYQRLIHRKYTLAHTRKILQNWLKEEGVSEDTFVHFLGAGDETSPGHDEQGLTGFVQEECAHLTPLLREVGQRQLAQAMLASLWTEQYRIPPEDVLALFPFLNRGTESDGKRFLGDLAELALMLQSRKPELFEAFILSAEEDSSFIQTLWSHLASRPPGEIFDKETIFPAILREAFERLLGVDEVSNISTSVESGFERPAATRVFLERREEMSAALKSYHLFKKKRKALKRPKSSEPGVFHKWESTFIQAMSPIPSLVEVLKTQLARIGIPAPPFFKEEEKQARRMLVEINRDFTDFYQKAVPIWEKGETPRPTMIQDIPFLLSKKRNVPDHAHVLYLLLDGMRWDLWERIKQDFFGKMPDRFRLVREGALWAHQPTTTSAQQPYLEQALLAAYPDRNQEELLWKISGTDEKIHAEKGGLEHLFGNVLRYLELDLFFRLRDLPARTLLVLFADHGFVENPGFSTTDKYAADRYIHGQDTPFEVIVPWAWVMRI
ncbi:MAG: hypothetical protein JSU72_11430 [Deltaproteobacteria bacterium]|nr:MAG: hypothetical protein JSU72_11430 [Deltaproteobacteria bacterium]